MSQPRTNQIFAITPDADHSGKEGYFVDIVADETSISADPTVAPFGVILEGDDATAANGRDSVATPGVKGTVPVKITDTDPGAIALGTKLILAAEDGTVKADTGAGARVIVAEAMEAGAAEEKIEARLIEPQVIAA